MCDSIFNSYFFAFLAKTTVFCGFEDESMCNFILNYIYFLLFLAKTTVFCGFEDEMMCNFILNYSYFLFFQLRLPSSVDLKMSPCVILY